jgi:hypothetical protein
MEMSNTDTSADAVERLIAPIRDHLERAEEENARLQYIKATIRVNGMRHGATEDEILKMQTGGMSFIQWMVERLDYSALAAERDALQAKLAKAVDALERIEDASKYFGNCPEATETTVRYAHETTRRLARTTLAELKGENDE